MLLHAIHAAHHGNHQILIHTVDTDVVVWAVLVTQQMSAEDELWVAFGTGQSLRYLVAWLEPEKARALPMFHTLTGCDTASRFAGHGTKTAWETWKSLPEFTDALLTLACPPCDIPERHYAVYQVVCHTFFL